MSRLGVHRQERELRRIFQQARWLALAAPFVLPVACSSAGDDATGGSGTGGAGTGGDHTERAEADESVPLVEALLESASCAPRSFEPSPPDACGDYVRLPCGLPPGVVQGTSCYLYLNDCKKICPAHYFNCHAAAESCVAGNIVKDATGGIDIDCSICAKGVGRIPAGLAPARLDHAPSALGDYFSIAAHLEAASVHAFRQLRGELAAHGAPARLRRAARRAQRDEVRHARQAGRMARRFGGTPGRPRVAPLPARAFERVAIENAVEGCVRETFGALVATWQAAHAGDPEIGRLMETIARDETRHAALSWAVARWARRRLDAEGRARLAERCRAAIETLRRETETTEVAGELVDRAGMPDARQQRAMLGALEDRLWGSLQA